MGRRATWEFKELPPKSKKGCDVEGCKKYADYRAELQKKPNGLFRFVVHVCAGCKLLMAMQSRPTKQFRQNAPLPG